MLLWTQLPSIQLFPRNRFYWWTCIVTFTPSFAALACCWHMWLLWESTHEWKMCHRSLDKDNETLSMASWLSIITQPPSPFPTFITAAVLDHVDSPLLRAGRRAEFALVVVGGAVAAAHCREALAWALRALALIPDASSSPGTNNAAACFCVERKAQWPVTAWKAIFLEK